MKRPHDLGVRPPQPHAPQVPFSHTRFIAQGSTTLAAAGSFDLLNINGTATVQWINLTVSAACSIQLLESGEPAGLSIPVNAGAFVRLAGRLIPNNAKLSLSVSAAATITWEVAWVKIFDDSVIDINTFVCYGPSGSSPINGTVKIEDTNGNALNSDGVGNLGVTVSNFPATQVVAGIVAVSNFPAIQPVDGSVAVTNFPANQAVTDAIVETNTTAIAASDATIASNTSTMTALLQGLQKSTDLLERILARMEADALTRASSGLPWIATDDVISNIQ